jgi:hypothetical protein
LVLEKLKKNPGKVLEKSKYGQIPKTAKEHASVLQGPFV